MDTAFSYQVRILICNRCGAPLEAGLGGGQLACRYCNAVNQFAVRDERPAFAAAPSGPISEEERIRRLRAQDGQPLLPPPSLRALIPQGELPPWKMQEALAIWQSARQELRSSSNYEAAERLQFLTMVLANTFSEQNDRMRQRAMFESALEAFTLPRHRQSMRGYLSRSACRSGDLQAAEQWLAPCDPRSDDLQTDSDYRFSRALLDTARGDYHAVLRTLGGRNEDVPIMDSMDAVCAVLRANAWEKLGNVQAAAALLGQAMKAGAGGRNAMAKFIELNPRLGLCTQARAQAEAQHAVVAGKAAASAASGGLHVVFIPLGALFLVISVACVVLLIVDIFADVAPPWPSLAGTLLFTFVPMGAVFGGIGLWMRKAARKAERLRLHGISGKGRLLEVSPTGLSINNVPQMRFRMQIELPGRAPYVADTKMLLSSMGGVQSGMVVPVRVDPQDPMSFMIETQ